MEESGSNKETKKKRPIFISVIMIILCGWLMYYYFEDISFFFSRPEPRMLGDAERVSADKLIHNTYISVSGIPDPRMLKGDSYIYFFFTKTYNYYVFMGDKNFIVKEPVELNRNRREEGLDTGPRTGRFIKFNRYPNQRELNQLKDFFVKKLQREINPEGGVLIVGERPYGDFFTLIIYLIFIGVMVFNLREIYIRFFMSRKEE